MTTIVIRPGEAPAVEEVVNTPEAIRAVIGGEYEAQLAGDDVVAILSTDWRELPVAGRIRGSTYGGTMILCGWYCDEFVDVPEGLIDYMRRSMT